MNLIIYIFITITLTILYGYFVIGIGYMKHLYKGRFIDIILIIALIVIWLIIVATFTNMADYKYNIF